MECNAINIKISLLLFAKCRSLNTLALPRIFTDCFEYPIPYLTQAQTEARRAGKRFFWDRPPFILGSGLGSGWPLPPPHPPPLLYRSGFTTSHDHFLWREYLTQVWSLDDVTTWTKPYRIGWKNKQKQKVMVHGPERAVKSWVQGNMF